MPRTKAVESMDERLELRLTTRQKARLTRAAKRAGLELGSWVRFVALREAERED